MHDIRDFMRLTVSESEKDKDWYKFHADRIIPAYNSLTIQDFEEMTKLYQFANNDLQLFKKEIEYYCGSLEEFGATEEDLIPYNPIPNKLEQLKGDLLARGNTHKVILLTAKAMRQHNEEFVERLKKSVDQELAIAVTKQQLAMQGMSDEEMQQHIAQLRTAIEPQNLDKRDFMSEGEKVYNKLLQFGMFDQDVRSKKMETFEDLFKVDRFFLYVGWKHGKPAINVLNPKHVGFSKNPNTPYIQHGDYVWYRDELTVADALQEYINKLDKDDIEKILQYGATFNSVDRNDRPVYDYTRYYSLLTALDQKLYKGEGMHQGTSLTNVNFNRTLWRVHLEFKAFKPVMFFTYKDEYGEKITVQLNHDASIIPDDASKVTYTNRYMTQTDKYVWSDEDGNEFEAEILTVPRRYEVTKLGNDIILDYREVPYQPDNYDNPFVDFELSYKGGICNSRNAKSISLMQRGLPYAFQYMALKRLQDREIAKYVGQEAAIDVDQIPDDLAVDHEGNALEGEDRLLQNEIIARKIGKRYYSGSRSSNGLPAPSTRTAGINYNIVDVSPQLINIQQLCNLVNAEMGIVMGVPPQREAATMPNTNVTDNKQALVQSTMATQSYFFFHDKVWSHALNEYLYYLKHYIKFNFSNDTKYYRLNYVSTEGTTDYLEITPEQLEKLEDIGLYLHDSGKEQLYFNFMTSPQTIQAFAQNAGEGVESISSILRAIVRSNSVEEVHELITIEADKQRERQEKLAQQQNQLRAEATKQQQQLEAYKSDLKLQADLQRLDAQKEADLQRAEIQAQSLAMQYDINKNKESDIIEKAKLDHAFQRQENAKDRQLELIKTRILANSKKSTKA